MLMAQNQRGPARAAYEAPEKGLDLQRYIAILRKRAVYLVIPFILVLAAGIPIVLLLPPMYLAEGKILVESQQIPTDLVRPTLTATANERIQVIEQRIMVRDNLLAIIDKFHVFASRRNSLSATQLLDLMRERARFSTFELNQARRGDGLTIALTVGFEYEQPEVAMQVANELITLVLAEDARNRANRAQETTKFLAQEVKRLQGNLDGIDAQIADFKRKHTADTAPDKISLQVALITAELQEKASVFSPTHPDVIRLKTQLAALEKLAAQTAEVETGADALQNQRANTQKQLDLAAEKLSAARLGENLERAQFSERLEVLEQAVSPQKPFKPNRHKLLVLVIGFAALAGIGCVAMMEMLDNSIRGVRDVYGIAAPSLVQGIPYIVTDRELRRQKYGIALGAVTLVSVLVGGLACLHFFVRPLDQLWATFVGRLFG